MSGLLDDFDDLPQPIRLRKPDLPPAPAAPAQERCSVCGHSEGSHTGKPRMCGEPSCYCVTVEEQPAPSPSAGTPNSADPRPLTLRGNPVIEDSAIDPRKPMLLAGTPPASPVVRLDDENAAVWLPTARRWQVFTRPTEAQLAAALMNDSTRDALNAAAAAIRAQAEKPPALHYVGYGEQSASALPAVCGVECSTWDKPLRYTFDRDKATCPACLAALHVQAGTPPVGETPRQGVVCVKGCGYYLPACPQCDTVMTPPVGEGALDVVADLRDYCGGCGDCVACDARAELSRLRAALAQAERERDEAQGACLEWSAMHRRERERADAAEQRAAAAQEGT